MEKRAPAVVVVVAAEGSRRRGIGGAKTVAGEVEAGKQGLERRIAIDEGGNEVGPTLDDRTEGENEEGEEEEGGHVGREGGGGFPENLRRAPEIAQPGMVLAHGDLSLFIRSPPFLFSCIFFLFRVNLYLLIFLFWYFWGFGFSNQEIKIKKKAFLFLMLRESREGRKESGVWIMC